MPSSAPVPTRSSVRAGDIVEIDFGTPRGSEPAFRRPAVVVSADVVLEAGPRTFHVVPVTSNVSRRRLTVVPVLGPTVDSAGRVHLLTVVAVEALTSVEYGNVGPLALTQIRELIVDLLDLPV
jgi:mRNA interferase MazF